MEYVIQKRQEEMAKVRSMIESAHPYLFTAGDLYIWVDGIHKRVEEGQIEHDIEKLAKQLFAYDSVNQQAKADIIQHVKHVNFMPYDVAQEKCKPNLIAFGRGDEGGYIDIDELKAGKLEFHNHNIEDFKSTLFFQKIPHNINIDILNQLSKVQDPGCVGVLKAFAPNIYKFFSDLVGEAGVRTQLLKIGYCFYRANPFKLAFMEVGIGDTGKTTFLRYLQSIIGGENQTGESLQRLSNYPFAIINLRDKLLNSCDDLNSKELIRDTGTFKMLTGNSMITAARKNKEAITFLPFAKHIFTANQLPSIDTDMLNDMAFFDRWLITFYKNQFKKNDTFQLNLLNNETDIEVTIIAALYALKEFLTEGIAFLGDYSSGNMELWKRQTNNIYDFIKTYTQKGILTIDTSIDGKISKETLYHKHYMAFMESELGHGEVQTKTKFTQTIARLFNISPTQIMDGSKKIEAYKGIREIQIGEEGYKDEEDPQQGL